jgi:hypothetical protein
MSAPRALLWTAVAGIAMLIGGCAMPKAGAPAEAVRPPPRLDLPGPPQIAEDGLAMLIDGAEVRVGQTDRTALQNVGRPRGAFDTLDPSPLQGDDWRVRGWSSQEVAFGLLTLDNSVALAVYTREDAPPDWFADLLSAHERAYADTSPSVVAGAASSYWFWNRGEERLMIVRVRGVDGKTSASVAVGLASVMDLLRMNEADAQSDVEQAHRLLERAARP